MRRSNREDRERRLITKGDCNRRRNCKGRRGKGRRNYKITSGRDKARASIRANIFARLTNGRLLNDVQGKTRAFSRRANSAQGRFRRNARLSARTRSNKSTIRRFLSTFTDWNASTATCRCARRRQFTRRARFLLRAFNVSVRFIRSKGRIGPLISRSNGERRSLTRKLQSKSTIRLIVRLLRLKYDMIYNGRHRSMTSSDNGRSPNSTVRNMMGRYASRNGIPVIPGISICNLNNLDRRRRSISARAGESSRYASQNIMNRNYNDQPSRIRRFRVRSMCFRRFNR